ncbi:MAG: diaminopimelate epimerase [Candidatus Omnitrophica bacterium]|nr:diaminopimelate epimerase [Candidatus Omnitrophota bacterium]
MKFTKMVASGNDFVVVDITKDVKPPIPNFKPSVFTKKVCDRRYGIGADGLLILEKSKKADFKMRIFNPDGTEPNMCGNGARCAALFFRTRNPRLAVRNRTQALEFETRAGIIKAEVKKDVVKLKMTDPKDLWANMALDIGRQFYKVHYVNTGVPHVVFFVGNVDTINVKEVGKQIRFHKQFQPEGTNANFAQIIDEKMIKIRTYERGVEDETFACGTGSVASAIIAFYLKLTKKGPVSVETKSGEILKIYFDYKNNKFVNVWLEGNARVVYEGAYFVGG